MRQDPYDQAEHEARAAIARAARAARRNPHDLGAQQDVERRRAEYVELRLSNRLAQLVERVSLDTAARRRLAAKLTGEQVA